MKMSIRVGVLAVLCCLVVVAVAQGLFCYKTVSRPCNGDFGLYDRDCPTPYTELDVDYEWRSAGPNCNNCALLYLGGGDKDGCEDDGPEFRCEYYNTITWCDGTTDDPYLAGQNVTPTKASGNSCGAGG